MFSSFSSQDLTGSLLVASPLLRGTNFAQALIYICRYSAKEGAMGVVINRPLLFPTREDVFKQLKMPILEENFLQIGVGGPVDVGRGFILHSPEWRAHDSLAEGALASLSASIDILKEIAEGRGPKSAILLLGHAGWAPGQLENEIYKENAWYVAPATSALLFHVEMSKKWRKSLENIGIKPAFISLKAGDS